MANTLFQFTPLREGRRKISVHLFRWFYFNSRPSARGDANGYLLSNMTVMISIHAPPRGATVQKGNLQNAQVISIHAPPRGATKRSLRVCGFPAFQFTPLREGRPFPVATRLSRSVNFNSRPSARGDALFIVI